MYVAQAYMPGSGTWENIHTEHVRADPTCPCVHVKLLTMSDAGAMAGRRLPATADREEVASAVDACMPGGAAGWP